MNTSKLRLLSVPLLLLLVYCTIAAAQAPSIEWDRLFTGPGLDEGNCVRQTSDRGYILAGTQDVFDDEHPVLIKVDPKGNTTWSETYGIAADGRAVRQTNDSGYVLVNTGYEIGSGNFIGLMKVNSEGKETWNKTVSGGFSSFATKIGFDVTKDGGYIFLGESKQGSLLKKLNSSGIEQWSKSLGTSGRSIQQTGDGGYVIAGGHRVIKINATGDVEWGYDYQANGASGIEVFSIKQTKDSGFIAVGNAKIDFDNTDALLLKLDGRGNITWIEMFGGEHIDTSKDVEQTNDGGYVLIGNTGSFGSGPSYLSDIWVIKTDSSGNQVWHKSIGEKDQDDEGYSIQQTKDGGYILTGVKDRKVHRNSRGDIWMVKLASDKPKSESAEAPSKSPAFEGALAVLALMASLCILKVLKRS